MRVRVLAWVHKLVNKPLGNLRLLHDTLLVVLPDGTAKLVVVHGWSVFTQTPQPGNFNRVFDLEDTCAKGRRKSNIVNLNDKF